MEKSYTMKKAVRKSLKETVNRFYDLRDPVLSFKDPEDLHQMRVAGRTLLSLIKVLSEDDNNKIIRPLKKAMRALGELRDMDVLIEEVGRRMTSMPPRHRKLVEAWLEHKKRERKSLRAALAKELPKQVSLKWKRRIKEWRNSRLPGLIDMQSMMEKADALRQEKDASIEAVRSYPSLDIRDDAFLDLLHDARIDVKRLRYALSIIRQFVEIDNDEIETLKVLQDRLGHIQDLRVWISQLQSRFGDTDPDVAELVACWRQEMIDTFKETGIMVNI